MHVSLSSLLYGSLLFIIHTLASEHSLLSTLLMNFAQGVSLKTGSLPVDFLLLAILQRNRLQPRISMI